MNQPIWTVDILKTLHPPKIADYLLNRGWHQHEQVADKASVWIKNAPEDEVEILLPLNSNAPDFVRRLTEVIETLEIVEQRSRSEILNDLAVVQQLAILMQREIIDFAIAFPSTHSSYAPIEHLGKILCAFQSLIHQTGQSLANQQNVSAGFEETELTATGTCTRLRLVSASSSELRTALISDSLKVFTHLLSLEKGTRNGQNSFSEEIFESYIVFLKSLNDAKSGLFVDWGSPRSGYGGTVSLTLEAVQIILNQFQPQLHNSPLSMNS
jgi:hypothetical protein